MSDRVASLLIISVPNMQYVEINNKLGSYQNNTRNKFFHKDIFLWLSKVRGIFGLAHS